MKISVYTNRHGHRNYGLVLSESETGMVELLLDPFSEFPDASAEAQKPRVRWVQPVETTDGPGTRIYPLNGQKIAWQTPEIKELVKVGTQEAIEAKRSERYRKFYAGSYS